MAKASDNVFPKVIHGMQTSDPSAPADSSWKTYAKADGIYARSSNGIVGPFGAGTNFTAAGSNVKNVSGRSYAGDSTTLLAPFDHEHLGVVAITSSASNTLQRPTVNLRAGTNIGFALSDADGNGAFDTLTITSTGTGGGGGSAPGFEYDYVAFTSPVNVTATTEGTANTIVTGNAVTYDGATTILVTFWAGWAAPDANASGRDLRFWLYLDGASIGFMGVIQGRDSTNNDWTPTYLIRRLSPTAGSHTYSIRGSVSAGTGIVHAGAGGAGLEPPGFIRITRV